MRNRVDLIVDYGRSIDPHTILVEDQARRERPHRHRRLHHHRHWHQAGHGHPESNLRRTRLTRRILIYKSPPSDGRSVPA